MLDAHRESRFILIIIPFGSKVLAEARDTRGGNSARDQLRRGKAPRISDEVELLSNEDLLYLLCLNLQQVHLLRASMTTIAVVSGENASANAAESDSKTTFNVGTRKSKLALVQADLVVQALAAACPDYVYAIKARDTAAGDIDKITPFKDMPVKNIWTHELETLMIEGQLDFLVHSLKGLRCPKTDI